MGSEMCIRDRAEGIRRHALAPYVLDPVMVATSGDVLLEPDAVALIRRDLLPLATLVTPNLDEAAILTGRQVTDIATMENAAKLLVEMGAGAALVKGGHLRGDVVTDVLWDGVALTRYAHARLDTRHTHGTGCTLSSAITAHLALGNSLHDAVQRSLDYVHRAIALAPRLGEGHGPLNHLA